VEELKDLAVTLGQSDVIKAEVVYCIQEEMAMKLEDVIFRRTGLGTATHPGEEVLTECSKVMASALGWDETRRHQEIEGVNAYFRKPVIKRSKDQKNI
jgi:glycerol-3-phosphate dehydrogenase